MNEKGGSFRKFRWALIIIFLISVVLMGAYTQIPGLNTMDPMIFNAVGSILVTLLMLLIVALHGTERYGKKNMLIFFMITAGVAYLFENINVATGWPAGSYSYTSNLGFLPVPFVIVFNYFTMGYLSWMTSQILTANYAEKLKGKQIFILPLVAAFIMVMWDLGMDPINSTILDLYIWDVPGPYFGVPIMNFVAWFVVVFIFFQLFALYISKYDNINSEKVSKISNKPYWSEAPVTYGIMGLYNILFVISFRNDLTISMALITVFTMGFVVILALVNIWNNPDLKVSM
jgi:putative membrane protein